MTSSPDPNTLIEGARPTRLERAIAWTVLAGALALAVFYALRGPVDSDEPQHLHVVWGWTQGQVQYRDFFDNHAPLFHMAFAPVVKAIGERADLLVWVRLMMLPMNVAAIACVYVIGKRLLGERIGLWGAAFAAVFPYYFEHAMEVRPDVLWMMLWLLALAVAVKPPLTWKRALTTGLILGLAAATSLKTTFLLVGLAATAIATVLATMGRYPWRKEWRRLAGLGAWAALGVLAAPTAVVMVFWHLGAVKELWYGAVAHNIMADLKPFQWTRVWLSGAALAGGIMSVATLARRGEAGGEAGAEGMSARRVFVLMLGSILLGTTVFWPIMETYSYLPICPLIMLMVAGCLEGVIGRAWRTAASGWAAAAFAGVLVMWLALDVSWGDEVSQYKRVWEDVLRLTSPGQKVMDAKGELIFRERLYYYVMEKLTALRIARGLITDDIAERLMATGTCVASATQSHYPPRVKTFMKENYVSVGRLLVAGKMLSAPPSEGEGIAFEVKIPAEYAIETPSGMGAGRMDGKPNEGSWVLEAGRHEYEPGPGETRIALVWAQAVRRGFSPFGASESTR